MSLNKGAGYLAFRLMETARGEEFVAIYDGYLCMLSTAPVLDDSPGWRWSIESGGGITLRGPAEECVIHAEGTAESAIEAEAKMVEWLDANMEQHPTIPLHNPSPEDVRSVRKKLKLSQRGAAQVASRVLLDDETSYRSWQNYETAKGKPGHRQIPRSTWELFLLLTNQHPYYCLVSRGDKV